MSWMLADMLLIVSVACMLVLSIGALAICFHIRDRRAFEEVTTYLEQQLSALDARLRKLEGKSGLRDDRSTPLLREQSRNISNPPQLNSTDMGFDNEPKVGASRAPQGPVPTAGPPASSHPGLRAEADFLHVGTASKALESAEACNKFAEANAAYGYGIDGDGRPSREPTLPPDRGEILVLFHGERCFVVPSFNMKRNQGLYTSDAGRAAQSRLGWLFELQRGEKLLAFEAAEITRNWTVIKKGRLALPLEDS